MNLISFCSYQYWKDVIHNVSCQVNDDDKDGDNIKVITTIHIKNKIY